MSTKKSPTKIEPDNNGVPRGTDAVIEERAKEVIRKVLGQKKPANT